MHLIAPLEKQFPVLYSLLTDHIAEDVDYKVSLLFCQRWKYVCLGFMYCVYNDYDGRHFQVIVFCTTAMVTKLVADLLSELRLNVREIHSRKPQSYRTRVSKEFKESKGLILVSSDVSARGVDYPDVTLVVQVICCNKFTYILSVPIIFLSSNLLQTIATCMSYFMEIVYKQEQQCPRNNVMNNVLGKLIP